VNEINRAINSSFMTQKLFTWPAAIEDPTWASLLTKTLNPLTSNTEEDDVNFAIHGARFYNALKAYPTAIKILEPEIANLGNNSEAYAALGNSYLQFAMVSEDPAEKKQKLDKARYFLEEAETFDSKNESVYSSLANLSIINGNYEDAKSYLEKYIKLNDHNDYLYFLSGVCSRYLWKKNKDNDDREEIIKSMKRSVSLNPQNGKAYLYLAEAYLAGGDRDKARENVKKVIETKNPLLQDEQVLLDQMKLQLGIQ
jgi:FimV-like protein